MPKLKITTVSKEFRTAWVEVDDETFARVSENSTEALEWASRLEVATEFSDAEETEVAFVDTEDGEALYES